MFTDDIFNVFLLVHEKQCELECRGSSHQHFGWITLFYFRASSVRCCFGVWSFFRNGGRSSEMSTEDWHHNCICCKIRLIIMDSTIIDRKMRHLRLIIVDSTIIINRLVIVTSTLINRRWCILWLIIIRYHLVRLISQMCVSYD